MIRSMTAIVLTLLVMGGTGIEAQQIPTNAILREALNNIPSIGPLPVETSQEQDDDDVYARLMGIASGTFVSVELRDGTEIQGRLSEVTEKNFRLLLESGDWRTSEIDEVVRIWIPPQVDTAAPDPTGGWGNKKANILAAIVAGALAGLVLVAIYR